MGFSIFDLRFAICDLANRAGKVLMHAGSRRFSQVRWSVNGANEIGWMGDAAWGGVMESWSHGVMGTGAGRGAETRQKWCSFVQGAGFDEFGGVPDYSASRCSFQLSDIDVVDHIVRTILGRRVGHLLSNPRGIWGGAIF